ncbi:hypothetical protein IMG5_021310 [Ichthyophthirius multifiliis]|uniref:protein-synthesizing GTPase n=1 Tax=Ichthyophthirius multifiliis TaxID=5932 RepID=G0QKS6_ICHMU|nr:hypothetical protein IMG5_021310 [Ichthyophthirius multifiliis]EGR34178.1 hypothetical protein IMG5_021310 [Ichthyophthirius multifiliis]|eukprot:XP_004039482.1 hypothetical protein IMG5_021310 [Ichthyophthirius multifiliis]
MTDNRLQQKEIEELMQRNPHLKVQTYDQIPNLSTLSPEVISRQATINIGTIGHVAHGKSTLVRAISGVHTVKFQQEKVRNITIRLGYANAKIFKCPKCPSPECYKSFESSKNDDAKCPNENCETIMELVRHVSFVDCPGHDILMSTMLTGAAVMDAALLIIAGNMSCPQPQTAEHLAAVDIMKLKQILIIQNKVDVIFKDPQAAQNNYKEIKNFILGTNAENSPIIPCSAQLKYNVDAVCQYICSYFAVPLRELQVPPKLIIIRSFDVNKPGATVNKLKGGVVGGSILQGVLKIGDEIEIRPGLINKDANNNVKCTPIKSRVVSLLAEKNELLYAVPGGLIGVGLLVDPSITRNDRLVGNVLGYPGKLPDIYTKIEVNYYLLKRLIGAKVEGDSRTHRIQKITQEILKFNVGSTETPGRVVEVKENVMMVELNLPICTQIGEKVAFSRRIDKKFRLIGWGVIKSGKTINQ